MAFDNCVATIRQAAPNLNEQQAKELKDEVVDILERLQADKNVVDLDAELKKAVNERVAQEERAAINEKRNRALNYKTRLKFIQRLREIPDKDIPKFLESIMAGEYGNSPYKRSVESTFRALERQAQVMFARNIEANGVPRAEGMAFLRNAENGELLMRESYEPGSTGNRTAKVIAEAMEDANEFLRKSANKHGADIAKIPGYLVKQSHDSLKVHRAGRDQWIKDILPFLDEERTFGRKMTDAQKVEHLEKSWATIISGRRDDIVKDLSAPPGFKGPGNMAKQLGHHRSLHFKDGQSAWSYMKQYGLPDVGTSFFGGVDMMSRSVAAMMHLGPNPQSMLDEVIDRARSKLRNNQEIANKINPKYIERMYEEVTGAASILPPYKATGWFLARATNWGKNLSSSALLGGTVLTSISDAGTTATRLADVGVPFLEAHASVLSVLVRGRGKGETRDVADSMAIGMDSLISGVQSRWLGNDGINGQGSNLISVVMRVTGMNWLNDSMKTAATLTLANYISKQVGKSFDAIHPQLRAEMSAYGITPDNWATLKNAVRDVEGKTYIDVDYILDADFALKMKEFFGGFADSAVLTPGARTNALIRGAGKRGEPMTEISMLFFHLKSFSIAYTQEIISRAFKNEGSKVGYGLHLILSMTVYGYIANLAKDLAAGKEPREPSMKAFFDAFMTAGGAGFYGDLVIGAIGGEQRLNVGFAEAVGGPILGTVLRTTRSINDLIEGDTDRLTYKTFRTAKSMIPGANIWYARTALDYMLWWQMAEYIKPGFARNFEKRVHEETGQDFYIRPTEAVN